MQTSNFQIIVLGICTTLILVGIGVFASFGGFLGGRGIGKVVVWGTLDASQMQLTIDTLRTNNKAFESVSYIEKDPATYDSELLNSMANGTAPDLFMLEGTNLISYSDKVLTIPYSAVSQSSYLGSFIDEAQLFLTPGGALALPFTIDPMVMYWNRDLFASAGVATPPKYWNDFLALSPKITSLDAGASVRRSAVALGEWRNIAHAKEILSTLFMQAGDMIIIRNSEGKPTVMLGTTPANYPANPAESALRFYTEFANPSKTSYAWNRSLPHSTDAFVSGDLAVYFGFASEYAGLLERNPNLHFSVAVAPQIEGNAARITFGSITGLAVPRTAKNASGGLVVAQLLSEKQASSLISASTGLPSVRRDVPADTKANAAAEVFLQSALISRAWLDPAPKITDNLFQVMIESVVSGKNQSGQAVSDTALELKRLVPIQ